MIRRSFTTLVVAALVVAGCSGDDDTATTTAVTLPSLPVTVAARPAGLTVPFCNDLPDPADSLDWTGVQRAAFPDPLRTRDALVVALEFPHIVDLWGGTGTREGWIVIGVTGGAVELQTVLDMQFPAARVLVMPIDWTYAELSAVAAAVADATAGLSPPAPPLVSMSRGLVRVQLGELTDDRVAALTDFGDDPVCIDL